MNMRQYMENQITEILKYKWIMGEKLGHDPGEEAVKEWIKRYGAQYRKEYEDVYDVILNKMLNSIKPDVENLLDESPCNGSEEQLKDLIKLIVDEFTTQWLMEKINDPDNKHLDEL